MALPEEVVGGDVVEDVAKALPQVDLDEAEPLAVVLEGRAVERPGLALPEELRIPAGRDDEQPALRVQPGDGWRRSWPAPTDLETDRDAGLVAVAAHI